MLLEILAILSLLPAGLRCCAGARQRDLLLWLALALAVSGRRCWWRQNVGGWLPSLSGALWVSVAAAMILFAVIAVLNETAWRLLPLLAVDAIVMGIAAALFAAVPGSICRRSAPPPGSICISSSRSPPTGSRPSPPSPGSRCCFRSGP